MYLQIIVLLEKGYFDVCVSCMCHVKPLRCNFFVSICFFDYVLYAFECSKPNVIFRWLSVDSFWMNTIDIVGFLNIFINFYLFTLSLTTRWAWHSSLFDCMILATVSDDWTKIFYLLIKWIFTKCSGLPKYKPR